MSQEAPFTTTVHPFPSPTPHTCAYESGLPSAKNALVFIGGLGDGPHTVPYPRAVAKRLESELELSYSVFEFRLASSFQGFGFSSLASDVVDISALVKYLRGIGKEKVVLMGHSTGCQDIMEYTSTAYTDLAPVDGFILQGPVSDREALSIEMDPSLLHSVVQQAKELIDGGNGFDRMPIAALPNAFKDTPISAYRFHSLASKGGDDDFFSSDLTEDETKAFWQRFDRPLLILHSAEDEFASPSLNKLGLIKKWMSQCKTSVASELSGLIPDANHRVEQKDSQKWLGATVTEFLKHI